MIKLQALQAGFGERRPLLVIFHASPEVVLRSLAGPLAAATVVLGMADSGGYGVPPRWDSVLSAARGAGWRAGPVVLAGYSAGCAAVRELYRADGSTFDVVIALDGTSGPRGVVPASPLFVEPWRALAERARRRNDVLFVATHTFQTYTEQLAPAERFPATVSVLRSATGWPLLLGGDVVAPVERREGDLVVLSYDSKSIDREAHIDQQRRALPHVLRLYVAPWLAALAGMEDTEPDSDRANGIADGTGEAALEFALSELDADVREVPAGSNSGLRVREYLGGCVRDLDGDGDEDPLRLGAAQWCAAFVGWCDSQAGARRPWRAAVAEICLDARRAGTLRGVEAYEPCPGDLAIFRRGGQNPLHGGLGHVARVETVGSDSYTTIDGNHGDRVARVSRKRLDPDLVAWVEYPHRTTWTAPPEVLGGVLGVSDLAAGRAPGGQPEDFITTSEGPALPG